MSMAIRQLFRLETLIKCANRINEIENAGGLVNEDIVEMIKAEATKGFGKRANLYSNYLDGFIKGKFVLSSVECKNEECLNLARKMANALKEKNGSECLTQLKEVLDTIIYKDNILSYYHDIAFDIFSDQTSACDVRGASRIEGAKKRTEYVCTNKNIKAILMKYGITEDPAEQLANDGDLVEKVRERYCEEYGLDIPWRGRTSGLAAVDEWCRERGIFGRPR
ncbi:MAG: hypothetical protein FWE47_03675 [Oscillospiraceae bacterium]|nr:hypothetical protein [Oscillospiraceae bacterium]